MNDTHTPPVSGMPPHADGKLDAHHRQQLSALFDGELEGDSARFLLRRLQHDPELAGCQERWQLLGDVLRGQACAPAPSTFAAGVAAAVAREPLPAASAPRRRGGWRTWGGGALAASVAAVALFMGRQALQEPTPDAAAPLQVMASQAELVAPVPAPSPTPDTARAEPAALLVAAAPAAAMAAAGRRSDAQAARRASATRTQQAVRAGQRDDTPQRALAVRAPLSPTVPAGMRRDLPFGDVGALQARPWPRSSLGSVPGQALNASTPASASAAFYPFEPRLQDDLPVQRPHD